MKRVYVSDMIYDNIIDDFLNDKFDFGDKFVETDYAARHNISRTPLREAIKKLEHDGLIVRLQTGRLQFLELTKDNVVEIFNIRVALENMLLEQIINNNDIINSLEANVISSENFLKDGDLNSARAATKDFTKIIYSNLNFQYTFKMLKENNLLVSKIKRKTLLSQSRIEIAIKEHREIINALKNNNCQLALTLNKEHILGAMELTLKKLNT